MSVVPNESAKKHRLRIFFDGVIAVGPAVPDERRADGPLFAVMATSTRRQAKRSGRSGPKTYIPVHVPTLFTKMKPLGRPPDEIFHLPFHPKWYLWHPVRERMEFRIDDSSKPGLLTYRRREGSEQVDLHKKNLFTGKGGPPEGRVTIRDIASVPDSRKFAPKQPCLKEGLLSPDPHVAAEVAAQVFVPFGDVAGGGIDKKGDGTLIQFDPDLGGLGEKTVVPNIVVELPAEKVEIVTYSLDTGEVLDSLIFQLEDDSEIWISNGDPTDMAVNIDRLIRRLTEKELEVAKELLGKAEGVFGGGIEKFFDLRHIIGHPETSNPIIPGPIRDIDFNRVSDVDIDFELFATLLGGEPDPLGFPVPKRPGGKVFDESNCYTCQTCPREKPMMKSHHE
jgi:hypothetical protein